MGLAFSGPGVPVSSYIFLPFSSAYPKLGHSGISKAKLSHSGHTGIRNLISCPFGQYPELVGEGRNVDRQRRASSCSLSSFFTTTTHCSACMITAAAPKRHSISRFIFPSLVNKTPKILELSGLGE